MHMMRYHWGKYKGIWLTRESTSSGGVGGKPKAGVKATIKTQTAVVCVQ